MTWNDDERAPEVSPFSGVVVKAAHGRAGRMEEHSLARICKTIIKELADPYKIMPTPVPEEDTPADAFDEPYYCAKSPSLESINALCEDELEESVSSSCEDDEDPPAGGRCVDAAETVEKSAEPKPFFYT